MAKPTLIRSNVIYTDAGEKQGEQIWAGQSADRDSLTPDINGAFYMATDTGAVSIYDADSEAWTNM